MNEVEFKETPAKDHPGRTTIAARMTFFSWIETDTHSLDTYRTAMHGELRALMRRKVYGELMGPISELAMMAMKYSPATESGHAANLREKIRSLFGDGPKTTAVEFFNENEYYWLCVKNVLGRLSAFGQANMMAVVTSLAGEPPAGLREEIINLMAETHRREEAESAAG